MGAVSLHDDLKDELKQECKDEIYTQKDIVSKLVEKYLNNDVEVDLG